MRHHTVGSNWSRRIQYWPCSLFFVSPLSAKRVFFVDAQRHHVCLSISQSFHPHLKSVVLRLSFHLPFCPSYTRPYRPSPFLPPPSLALSLSNCKFSSTCSTPPPTRSSEPVSSHHTHTHTHVHNHSIEPCYAHTEPSFYIGVWVTNTFAIKCPMTTVLLTVSTSLPS